MSGDWIETFQLMDGTLVQHSPTSVVLGSISGGSVNLTTPKLNGMALNGGCISLSKTMSRYEFVSELRRAGVYHGN
jgi:hypothetical protein